MSANQTEKTRSGWLTGFLVYLTLSNAWGAYRSIETYWDLVTHHDPRFPHWPFLALAMLSVFGIVGVTGIWMWKKWGFYLLCACWAAATVLNIFLGFPFWVPLLGLAGLIILFALLKNDGELFQ